MRCGVSAVTVPAVLYLCAALPGAASAQGFAGVVRYRFHSEEGDSGAMVQMSKAGKFRTDFSQGGHAFSMIVDSVPGTITMINSADKSYIVMQREQMQQMALGMQGMAQGLHRMPPRVDSTPAQRPKGNLTRTGRSEQVAGVTCEVYAYQTIEDNKPESGEACVAKGVGAFQMGMGGMGVMSAQVRERMHSENPAAADLLAQGYGLLKLTKQVGGKSITLLEVTGIERVAPGDDQFKPPAGYHEMNMGGMMRMGHDSH